MPDWRSKDFTEGRVKIMIPIAPLALLIGLAGMEDSLIAVPAGTELQIRLATKVASDSSKAEDKVEAFVIAPITVNGVLCIPAGFKVHGSIKDVKSTEGKADQRAQVKLEFNVLEDASGNQTKFSSQLTSVENARESVDDQGQIIGILASETISARMDQEINYRA
jgi:hypothetical protein